jgi:hypothetical protein
MVAYKTNRQKLPGTSFKEVEQAARAIFRQIKSRSKRTPYVRSKYFRKEKVFLNIFWQHLHEKHEKDRVRRLKFYDCAIDLIQHSTLAPETRENFQNKDELLHRFLGQTKSGDQFVVQIKEDKRSGRKDLISIYPVE